MPSTPPSDAEAILKTGELASEFLAAQGDSPPPDGSEFSIEELQELVQLSLPNRQKQLAASRPSTIVETEHSVLVRDGWQSRTIRCCPALPPSGPSPLLVLLYGGGHCIGYPELELALARELVTAHNATVYLPSYRLAPEHPFPASIHDTWDILQALARASTEPSRTSTSLIPPSCDPTTGFIVGGTSAGANLTAALAHLARDFPLTPPLTGQYLCAGAWISPNAVPPKYQSTYLSSTQNANAPMLSATLYAKFRAAHRPDFDSPLWASFDQKDSRDVAGEVWHGHVGLPPTYLQVCGADVSRDDGLIYERVLREESGVLTRLDLYAGWPHCWWSLYPTLEKSVQRQRDAVEGIGWLLEVGRKRNGET